MKLRSTLKILLLLGITLVGFCLFFKPSSLSLENLIAQSTYYGPKGTNLNPQLIRVEVLVHDSPIDQGVQIESAEFDKTAIPLKTRDIYGYRGGASFQKLPGKYKLRWTINRSHIAWPRSIAHEEIVELNPRDLWVQISIVGEKATIH